MAFTHSWLCHVGSSRLFAAALLVFQAGSPAASAPTNAYTEGDSTRDLSVFPVGDLDSDGMSDFVVTSPSESRALSDRDGANSKAVGRPRVSAYSGKTLSRLYSLDAPMHYSPASPRGVWIGSIGSGDAVLAIGWPNMAPSGQVWIVSAKDGHKVTTILPPQQYPHIGSQFGASLSIARRPDSSHGVYLLVGAPIFDGLGERFGAVECYTYDGGGLRHLWHQEGTTRRGLFGLSSAIQREHIDEEEQWCAVGAPSVDKSCGSVHVLDVATGRRKCTINGPFDSAGLGVSLVALRCGAANVFVAGGTGNHMDQCGCVIFVRTPQCARISMDLPSVSKGRCFGRGLTSIIRNESDDGDDCVVMIQPAAVEDKEGIVALIVPTISMKVRRELRMPRSLGSPLSVCSIDETQNSGGSRQFILMATSRRNLVRMSCDSSGECYVGKYE